MASTINASSTGVGGLVSSGDSSGELQIQTGGTTAITVSSSQAVSLANALPVASGGTGATSLTANNVLLGNGTSAVQAVAPGTNGNVLTSNGTTWTSAALPAGGVTSLNGQTGAITNTDYGAIGSYVIAYGAANTAYSVGSTIAGSSLVYISGNSFGGMNFINESGSNFDSTFRSATSFASTTLGLSGTWRTMTRGGGTPSGNVRQAHLWVRIS